MQQIYFDPNRYRMLIKLNHPVDLRSYIKLQKFTVLYPQGLTLIGSSQAIPRVLAVSTTYSCSLGLDPSLLHFISDSSLLTGGEVSIDTDAIGVFDCQRSFHPKELNFRAQQSRGSQSDLHLFKYSLGLDPFPIFQIRSLTTLVFF